MAFFDKFPANTLLEKIFPELKTIIIYYSSIYRKYAKLDIYEEEENYDKYFMKLTSLADKGCVISQKKLMNDYLSDKNLKQNHDKTVSFYQLNKNYSYSCTYYGWIYRNRYKFENIANEYYEKAVKMGNPIAMYNMAFANLNSNKEKSIELFQKSSEWGNPRASYELAEIYLESNNYEKAIYYYLDAIDKGFPQKQQILILLTAMATVLKKTVVLFEKFAESNSVAASVLEEIYKNNKSQILEID